MGIFRRTIHTAMAVLLIGAFVVSETEAAELDAIRGDGWYTWQAPAVENAPRMCCMSWNMGRPTPRVCDLDKDNGSFGSIKDQFESPDTIQMYVRIRNGEVRRIRTLSPQCEVTTRHAITDLGLIESRQSVEWLGKRRDSDTVMAVAMHEGQTAQDLLENAARSGASEDIREEAIFWAAQVRINEMGGIVKDIMHNDDDSDIREHAIFAYADSGADDVVETLATILEDKNLDMDTREHALFWLAQSDTDEAFEYLDRLLN